MRPAQNVGGIDCERLRGQSADFEFVCDKRAADAGYSASLTRDICISFAQSLDVDLAIALSLKFVRSNSRLSL